MKQKTYRYIILMTAACLAACSERELEITPTDRLSDAVIWESAETATLVLNDIYDALNAGPIVSTWLYLPSQISNDPLENFTDNTLSGPVAGIPSREKFENNSYGPSNALFDRTWERMYANIRKCNLFLEKMETAKIDEAQKKPLIAQARFLRAHFYKTLIDLYGGVPLITDVLDNNTQGDSIYRARNTYEECIAFLETEADLAAAELPDTWGGPDIGRATKGAALTMKGESQLYAGYWEKAAATNRAIIESGVYSLFPDINTLFAPENENNSEIIFDVQYAPVIRSIRTHQYWGAIWVQKGSGWGAMAPTQNLVDDYEFLDGKTASEGSAHYDPAQPYKNRSKRFYANILYDGCTWHDRTYYTRLGIPNNFNEFTPSVTGNGNPSGYGMRKLLDATLMPLPDNLNGSNAVIYRYAEVLLNYAEAQNEAVGPDASVYAAIDAIRERAGLPKLPVGLSQAEMRSRIRRERRVELAFEGKRFFDLLRWRIAESVFSKPINGMKITGTTGNLNYEVTRIRQVVFDPSKNYLMPIPQTAIDRNPKLIQNPNY
ncbi:RagB/SusD family nutrient uptake outer membrane protein [Parapedobacter sp. DT-150]|uniref:RagB/SusD family nutrient uptake outer membrane protein n=1 Tax=Parapedobacter sp. DT-150 TaxID=3396162 RepID=UPI003F1D0FBC